MSKPESPCKDCERRNPGCHSACELYTDYKVANEKYKDELRQIKGESRFLTSSHKRFYMAMKKKGK